MPRFVPAAAAALALALAPAAFGQTPQRPSSDPATVPAGTYKLDPRHASLAAKVSHFGFSNYTMLLRGVDGTIVYDPRNIEASKVSVTVDPRTVDTGIDAFDKEIGEDPRFFAGKPITFVSRRLERTGGNKGRLLGDLTFRGVTRPVALDVTFNGYAPDMRGVPTLGFSATGQIKRSDFGFTHLAGAIGDEVDLLIEAEFNKA